MEDNILQSIEKAEKSAADIKAQAQDKATKIIAAAEKSAADISRSSEAECAAYREKALKDAEILAEKNYEKKIQGSRAEAQSYADSLLNVASIHVTAIVGRLVK